MKTWTYSEVKTKIQRDLDLQDETFITADELIDYVNEGIDEAEAEIHKLHEDYFLTSSGITLVNGTASYVMPTSIYANKIRGIVYQNGSRIYEVRRLRGQGKPIAKALMNYNPSSTDDYRYDISNDSVPKVVFYPTPQESGAYMTAWFLRNAARVPHVGDAKPVSGTYSQAEVDAFSLDIPEFTSFVIQFAKVRCLEKEGDPRLDGAVTILQQQRKMMIDTLTQMVPDDDDTVPMDLSFYEDHE